ncbi:Pectinesterase [Actinidia chinensis var. chinensis]|uniref:Pectinesterase n=1 Tax=Actinidia chinensis var. chinensis TaxID=1590841 RepID=A0A2R6PLY5_ACTCC|nr:Pectinesterase [Actinidia chinensis var. chinensis]
MSSTMTSKLVFLLVLFTITTSWAIQNATVDEENYEQGLLERELRGKRSRRWPRGIRPPRVLPASAGGIQDVVVAQDGSGNYRTIKEALDAAARRGGDERFVIYVKEGVYRETLTVRANMKNIMLAGDGLGRTIITSGSNAAGNKNTLSSATVVVLGDGFVARDITFQNTHQGHQAPAIAVDSQRAAFYRCGFKGYQDTIYARHGQQFYRECNIYGTVDFICGDATAIFQNCKIYARKRSSPANTITITASKREAASSSTGFIFHNCRVMADSDLKPVIGRYKIYLGRPWGAYARTVFIQNDFDIPVDPKGWMPWDRVDKSKTVYYAEYNNKGVGSSTQGRVRWPGVRVITDPDEIQQFTVANFIQGDTWLPDTGLPFTANL